VENGNDLAERKCYHDQGGYMHDCKGDVEILVRVRLKGVTAQFNSNYRSGKEVLEDEAVDIFLNDFPENWEVDVRDVFVTGYEQTPQEREVERED